MPEVRLEWDAATDYLNQAQNIVVIGHVRPDGDAIGSMLGLGLMLMTKGKSVTMAVDEGVPEYLTFIPGSEHILPALPEAFTTDLVISVDSSDPDRLGECGQRALGLQKPVIVIDHHATNIYFGNAHIVHSDYVSTTEALLHWFDHLGWTPSLEAATALMTGYITDTIAFKVGPVTGTTFGQVQRLLDWGVDMKRIIQKTMNSRPTGTLKLEGRILSRVELAERVIWTYLTQADLEELQVEDGTYLEIASGILRDDGADIAAQFTETVDGDVRVSFRAVPGFDVGSVALSLGGGGHTLASGCTLQKLALQDAIAKVIPLLQAEAKRGVAVY